MARVITCANLKRIHNKKKAQYWESMMMYPGGALNIQCIIIFSLSFSTAANTSRLSESSADAK
jgi:hypothetical protein